jgi:UDP-N-acetyl-D-glucosamine dehydrogenase
MCWARPTNETLMTCVSRRRSILFCFMDRKGVLITYSDPYVPRIQLNARPLSATDSLTMAAEADCVVIVTDHAKFDYPAILERAKLIVDTRNAFKNVSSDKIVRL